jgi:ubiquinone/menaquinone biosynthesis C-methylase UbiE
MYRELAEHYDRISSGKDYTGESARLVEVIRAHAPGAKSLLDVACGTGSHLEVLAKEFECEGADLNEEMLAVARQKVPGVPLHVADMTALDIGRRFDAVTCLFSAVGHLITVERLNKAVQSMAGHVASGGVLAIEPWITPEKWLTGRLSMDTFDGDDVKITRMAMSEPVERGRLVFEYLIGTKASVTHLSEEHRMGWFTHAEYIEAFKQAELDVQLDEEGLNGRGLYIGLKPL